MQELKLNLQNNWLRRYQKNKDAKCNLVCFPHAGGSASFYRNWNKFLPTQIEVIAVQYPGREDRILEAFINNMEELADKIVESIATLLDKPLVLFGHSMGAAVAYEVACRLETKIKVSPVRLFVSGRPPPNKQRSKKTLLYDSNALWKELYRLGGTSEIAMKNTDLQELLLPIMQNDYCLIESYRCDKISKLFHPITAIIGDADDEVSYDEAMGWGDLTIDKFNLEIISGNHFYLIHKQQELIEILMKYLSNVSF